MEEVNQTLALQQPLKIKTAFFEYGVAKSKHHEIYSKALDTIRGYIHKFHQETNIETIDESFFAHFYNYFLPTKLSNITSRDLEKIKEEWNQFIEFTNKEPNTSQIQKINPEWYKTLEIELTRLKYLIKEIRKYGEIPVLSWEPLIIDLNCYKNMKNNENTFIKYTLHEKGHFVIHDKISNILILKKLGTQDQFFKIKIQTGLLKEMKIGDILQMNIKRKVFCTSWNISSVKAYFNEQAKTYINPSRRQG